MLSTRCFQGIGAEEVVLPASLRTIGEGAFRKSNVRRVMFEDRSQVTHIGANCFEDSALEEFYLPKTVKTIEHGALEHCDHLVTVYVEDEFEVHIQQHVSAKVNILPSKQTLVLCTPLWEYREQKKPKLPEGVDVVERYWFAQSDIESMTFSIDVTVLDDYSFYKCKNLRKVMFPKYCSLERLGTSCFAFSGIEEVTFPKDLVKIEDSAFCHCNSLRRVTFNEGLQSIEGSAFAFTGLESVKLPSTLRRIGQNAFAHCSSLKSVRLQEGLTGVGEGAFRDTAVEEMEFPRSVEQIGSRAFCSCGKLKKLTFAPDSLLRKVGEGAFCGTGLQFERSLFPEGARVLRSAFKE